MKIPRDVSGTHLASTLCRRWQYTELHQAGSHIILETAEPIHQRICVASRGDVSGYGPWTSALRVLPGKADFPRYSATIERIFDECASSFTVGETRSRLRTPYTPPRVRT